VASGDDSRAVIIDPGDEEKKIKKVLAAYRLTPACIINTHGHIDHIGCDDMFGVTVYVHADDMPLLRDASTNLSSFLAQPFTVKSRIMPLVEGQLIGADKVQFEVIHMPGHTPGGIALLMKQPQTNILFTGDSLFCGSIGRSDFPGADGALLLKSIKEKLLSLNEETVVYPGHGASSTIGEEKDHNPFLV
jgi:glyoxylase-like metal-dependent hydrolase (beta-lactamase superfamily II)